MLKKDILYQVVVNVNGTFKSRKFRVQRGENMFKLLQFVMCIQFGCCILNGTIITKTNLNQFEIIFRIRNRYSFVISLSKYSQVQRYINKLNIHKDIKNYIQQKPFTTSISHNRHNTISRFYCIYLTLEKPFFI